MLQVNMVGLLLWLLLWLLLYTLCLPLFVKYNVYEGRNEIEDQARKEISLFI